MKGYISPEQRDKIIKEIREGNPFNGHIAKLAKVNVGTVKKYRKHVAEGKFPMYYKELKP